MKNNILFALAITLFIQLYPTESQAYRYWNCYGRITKWNSPPTFYYNGVSFPNNSSGDYWMRVFETEIDKIRKSGAGSTIKNIRNGGRYGGNRVVHGNGRSEFFFKIQHTGHIGQANTRYSRCGWDFSFDFDDWIKYHYSRITESDIHLSLDNNRYLRTSVNSFYKRSGYRNDSMKNVIIHEVGHALGMFGGSSQGHEQRWPLQTMRSLSPGNESGNWNGGQFWPYPSNDYLAFLYDAYGKGESFRDFSISSIRADYSNPNNAQETRIFLNNSNSVATRVNANHGVNGRVSSNCTYQLNRNTTYKLEFTFLNQGSNTQHNGVKGKVYVSTNNYISTWDTPVSSEYTVYSTSRWPHTYKVPFRIVSNQLSNNQNYYIGYVVDYNNQYQEKYEGRTNGGANLCKIRIVQ